MPRVLILEAGKDFNVSITLTDDDGAPASGIPVEAYVSATRDYTTAAAIHSDVTPTMPDTDAEGTSEAVIQGSAIAARLLPTYKNKRVWLIKRSGSDYFEAIPCRVRDGGVYA